MIKPTLLSPAGTPEALKKAAVYGAGAVYLGTDKFNARLKAENFNTQNLKEWIDFAHLFGIKVYVTLNTMIKENEMAEAKKTADFVFDSGADGLIITDPGLLDYCVKRYSGIEIFASTQLSVMNKYGALAMKNIGADGVVVAREAKTEDINAIASANVKTEVFIHGAMCVCASGNCYLSSMADGYSGNRGLCAQPCRKKYTAYFNGKKVREGYLLSMKDLCTAERISEFLQAGATTFKIEGRNRRAEYAAGALLLYSEALKKNPITQKLTDMKKLFNRGDYTEGYAFENSPSEFISDQIQGHKGYTAGKVQSVNNGKIKVFFYENVEKGNAYKIISGGMETGNALAHESFPKGSAVISFRGVAKPGDDLNVTTDKKLLDEINSLQPKIHLKAVFKAEAGQKASLTLFGQDSKATVFGNCQCQRPENHPTTEIDIRKAILKTGNTVFIIDEAEILAENVFIPISSINDMRREAIKQLTDNILFNYNKNRGQRGYKDVCIGDHESRREFNTPKNKILCLSENSDFSSLYNNISDIVVYRPWDFNKKDIPEALKKRVGGWYLDLPYLAGEKDIAVIKKWFSFEGFKGMVANNVYALQLSKEADCEVIGGLGLNIANKHTVEMLKERFGMKYFIYSQELTRKECSEIADPGGYIFLSGDIYDMTLSHCPYMTSLKYKDCAECKATSGPLEYVDELGNRFAIVRRKVGRCYFSLINCAYLDGGGSEESGTYHAEISGLVSGRTNGRLRKGVK